jgi:hypothetical protein
MRYRIGANSPHRPSEQDPLARRSVGSVCDLYHDRRSLRLRDCLNYVYQAVWVIESLVLPSAVRNCTGTPPSPYLMFRKINRRQRKAGFPIDPRAIIRVCLFSWDLLLSRYIRC